LYAPNRYIEAISRNGFWFKFSLRFAGFRLRLPGFAAQDTRREDFFEIASDQGARMEGSPEQVSTDVLILAELSTGWQVDLAAADVNNHV